MEPLQHHMFHGPSQNSAHPFVIFASKNGACRRPCVIIIESACLHRNRSSYLSWRPKMMRECFGELCARHGHACVPQVVSHEGELDDGLPVRV